MQNNPAVLDTDHYQIVCCSLQMAYKQVHVEIPGYYYDEKKRRYFRHSSMQMISNIEPSGIPSTNQEKMKQPSSSSSFYHFNMRRQHDSKLSTSHLYECIACSLKKKKVLPVFRSEDVECYDNIVFNHLGNILAIKSTTPSHIHEYGVTVSADREYDLHQKQIFSNRFTNKVEGAFRSLDFLPPAEDGTESLLALHSSKEIILSKIRLAVQSLGSPETSHSFNCVKVKDFVCTAVWNRTPNTHQNSSFVIGCTDGSIQLRNIHRKLVCLQGSWKSPAISLGCDHQRPLLYAGYRNGCINIWDLRAKPRCIWTAREPADGKVASSVIGLHPLSDGNYFVSNACNSNLSLWDFRMKSKTLLFRGHINTFKHCKSIVDRAETFVAAVGSDLCVRLWSLRTGELLQTLDYDDYSETDGWKSSQTPPVISYTESFGGRHVNPVLLIAYDGTQTTFSISGHPFRKDVIDQS